MSRPFTSIEPLPGPDRKLEDFRPEGTVREVLDLLASREHLGIRLLYFLDSPALARRLHVDLTGLTAAEAFDLTLELAGLGRRKLGEATWLVRDRDQDDEADEGMVGSYFDELPIAI